MRNNYRIEIWRYHICVDKKTFTNRKKSKKWLKERGYDLLYDWGGCMIYIYVNNVRYNRPYGYFFEEKLEELLWTNKVN